MTLLGSPGKYNIVSLDNSQLYSWFQQEMKSTKTVAKVAL